MAAFQVYGGKELHGEIKIQGAKNAVLPVLAATVLNNGVSVIHNCPKILDVYNMLYILEAIGCSVTWEGNTLRVDASSLSDYLIPDRFVREMRSSIILLGSVLGRLKNVKISFPGGCSIGTRPIDLHLKALRKMNVEIIEAFGFIECRTAQIQGGHIVLDYPSVGATENIILAAVLSEGVTRINNAAKEPEIVELQDFLNAMGARVTGAGTDEILVEGVQTLKDIEYTIMPDRIVAGTYLAATAISGGKITLQDVSIPHLSAMISKFREMGCGVKEYKQALTIQSSGNLKSVDIIRTQPYPGFPTDMQSQIMSVLTVARGVSVIVENIFEARFKTVNELLKMGADIIVEGRTAVIKGVRNLKGAEVCATDLRGGAALVIAGLRAEGLTIIDEPIYIQRGYEDICADLKAVGANIHYQE